MTRPRDSARAPRFSAAELVAAVDGERERTAQLLHDSLSQTLGAVALTFQLVQRSIGQGKPSEEVQEHCEQVEEMIREALLQTQHLTLSLHVSNDRGRSSIDLASALDIYFERVSRHHPCSFSLVGKGESLHPTPALQLLRIAQEAVELAKGAGREDEVVAVLRLAPDVVRLEIRSDGIVSSAVDDANPFAGLGLIRMRAEIIGARMHIEDGLMECQLPVASDSQP